MAMKCPSCGGTLIYHVDGNYLKCEYCDSQFDPKQYDLNNAGSKTQTYEFNDSANSSDTAETSESSESNGEGIKVDRYLCKNCGAELCAPEEQIVSYCLYCGGEATLTEKASVMERPTGIIPFKLSKEKVQEQYVSKLANKPFVPKEFKDAKFIEGFRGIYIPYWRTRAKINQDTAVIEGTESETRGGYDYIYHYDLTLKFKGDFNSGSFDASESFDDTIAAEIAPFKAEDIEPFKESYLAGFYADRVTVPLETYNEKIDEMMLDSVCHEIDDATNGIANSKDSISTKVDWTVTKKESLLFPVWFLTWKNKDRVAYSVMNGQTGYASIDVPVDMKKFFLAAAVLSVVLFGVLCIIPSFVIPLKIAGFAALLLFLSGLLLRGELRKIMQLETHAFDLGKLQAEEKAATNDAEKSSKKKASAKKSDGCLAGFGTVAGLVFMIWILVCCWGATTTEDLQSALLCMSVAQVILFFGQLSYIRKIEKKSAWVTALIAVVIQVISMLVVSTGVQADIYYYGIAVASLTGMIISIITCASYINFLTTRPVPNFFTREGANNGR